MSPEVRVHTALTGHLGLIPSTHVIEGIPTLCNFSFRRSITFFWLLQALYSCALIHTPTHIIEKKRSLSNNNTIMKKCNWKHRHSWFLKISRLEFREKSLSSKIPPSPDPEYLILAFYLKCIV